MRRRGSPFFRGDRYLPVMTIGPAITSNQRLYHIPSDPILFRHFSNLLQGRPIIISSRSIRPGHDQRVVNITSSDDFHHWIREHDASGISRPISPFMMVKGHLASKGLGILIVIAEEDIACCGVMFEKCPLS